MLHWKDFLDAEPTWAQNSWVYTDFGVYLRSPHMLGLFLMHLIGLDKFHTFMAEPVIFFYWVDEQVSFYTVLSQLVCPEK